MTLKNPRKCQLTKQILMQETTLALSSVAKSQKPSWARSTTHHHRHSQTHRQECLPCFSFKMIHYRKT